MFFTTMAQLKQLEIQPEQLQRLISCGPVQAALECCRNIELDIEPGHYDLTRKHIAPLKESPNGEGSFLRITRKEPQSADDVPWEMHRMYVDFQYIVDGAESLQVAPSLGRNRTVTKFGKREGDDDIELYTTKPIDGAVPYVMEPRESVAIIFPGQPHRPGLLIEGKSGVVCRAVVKIKYELLAGLGLT